ncbi:hypothetical protein [Nocardia pseudovaccinii]|uniref:hypothetical protein n=1 Tax=Nocardia pseudovaccinii TaxID=189540 RepID=UPI000A79EE7F|nr:hypothetical protein [Nocardia pseudovaccinii]
MFDHFAPPPVPATEPLATLLDVTLRDGGFEVDFHWPDNHFGMVAATGHATGVDIVELGYIGGVPLEHSVARAGVGAYLTPDHIAAAVHDGLTLAAMVHPSALSEPVNLAPYAEAGLAMVRLVYHPRWAEAITALATEARHQGLIVAVNLALASRYTATELVDHATRISEDMAPDVIYVADTCSALTPEQVGDLVGRLRVALDSEIGFHAHDFLHLAYANALAAAAAGATYLDCSLLGLGRGGGNLAAEPLLLRHRLPDADAGAGALLLQCRSQLAATTGRRAGSLVAAVCATLNLTPVEEQALREFAALEHVDTDTAALWLLTQASRVSTLRPQDLRTHWHQHTPMVGR